MCTKLLEKDGRITYLKIQFENFSNVNKALNEMLYTSQISHNAW